MAETVKAAERGDKANILIVDDLPEKLLVFQSILEDLGQNLVMVRSGSAALAELLRREFAVILLDVNMPDMDGFETAALIRQYKRSAHTPIIFITAYADEMQTAKGYSLGAVDYILSPIRPEVLRSKVKVFVELYQLQQSTRQITEERVALARAEAARRGAEETNRRKDEFIAMLSHELRNPLAPIRAAIQVIRRIAPPDPKLSLASDMIDRQVGQLVRLVDELLDVSRIGTGRINLKKEQVELAKVIAQGVETARPLIDLRKQTLELSLPTAPPIWLSGDPVRLGQVVANLLNNAAKYTPEGGRIEVSAAARRGEAVITVQDNGLGIEADLLPRVFDLFVQGDRSLDRREGGLGLGLTLVRNLVELHHGRVEAHSEGPGKGARFKVFLPCINAVRYVDRAETAATPATPPRGRRVLVVDDNADAAESIAMLLRLAGHEVKVITQAAEVIPCAAVFAPHVALLDIGLPGLDGYELARRLRQEPEHSQLALIALTGYGLRHDRERASEAGFDHHFVKPVDAAELETAIAAGRNLRERPSSESPEGRRSSK
ncbi:MAG TPA: response regulator [Burkholderiales bacterium]|nr:response regulator [Burkholderiales bacterium]